MRALYALLCLALAGCASTPPAGTAPTAPSSADAAASAAPTPQAPTGFHATYHCVGKPGSVGVVWRADRKRFEPDRELKFEGGGKGFILRDALSETAVMEGELPRKLRRIAADSRVIQFLAGPGITVSLVRPDPKLDETWLVEQQVIFPVWARFYTLIGKCRQVSGTSRE